MSTYVGKLLTSISSALEFNTATLSGAIDIIVIEDDNGRRQCSPFHVRFGKLQLLKSRGIPVNVELNGSPTTLTMLLGAAGEAYFYSPSVNQAQSDDQPRNPLTLPDPSFTSPTIRTSNDILSIPAAHGELKRSFSSDLMDEVIPIATDPKELKTSTHTHHEPRWTSQQLTSDYSFAYTSDSEVELTRNEREGTSEVVDEPRSPPVNSYQRKWNSVVVQNYDVTPPLDPIVISPITTQDTSQNTSEYSHSTASFFDRVSAEVAPSDPTLLSDPSSQSTSNARIAANGEELPGNPQSNQTVGLPYSMTDLVGEEDSRMECRSIDEQDEEQRFEALQERVASVFPESSQSADRETIVKLQNECSEKETLSISESLPTSFFEKLHYPLRGVAEMTQEDELLSISMCGHLLSSSMKEDEILELFDRHRISFPEFETHPSLLFDPALIVKIENRLVEFRVAAAYVFALLSFRRKVDIDKLTTLLTVREENEPTKSSPTPSRRFAWFGWSSPAVQGVPLLQQDDLDVLEAIPPSSSKTDTHGKNENNTSAQIDLSDRNQTDTGVKESVGLEELSNVSQAKDDITNEASDLEKSKVESENGQSYRESMINAEISFSEIDPEALSLRPPEAELQKLDLRPGANEVRFIVPSSAVELSCRIFLWNCHTKIVISDVDGTITRSDVLGHLLPAVGRDWSQVGVAGLYTHIEKNGYKVLYLTARPIGQASQTRSFLHSVTQGSAKLPNGPVLMSPNRLVESFTREVIHRKPHEFKITALREIRSLFPPDYNPYHAGFGNRDSDIISYRAVGLIPQRIFVVNPKGELVVTNARYESTASYSTLQALVESVFPDISRQSGLDKVQAVTESASFNDWNFWKGNLPDIDLDSLLEEEATEMG